MFAFLAVVFAVSFVFFGVGSGSGALSDLFTFNWFSGGSSDPVEKLVKKLEKDPTNTTVLRDLGTTLDSRTPPRIDDAVRVYERWVQLRPRSVDALSTLANEYGKQAQAFADQTQTPKAAFLAPLDSYKVAPSNTPLGQALDAQVPTELSSTSLKQGEAGQLLSKQKRAYENRIAAYQRLAKIQPDEPGWTFQVADTTRQAGERLLAIQRYQEFIKKVPDDASVSIAQGYIKQLRSSTTTTTTGTG